MQFVLNQYIKSRKKLIPFLVTGFLLSGASSLYIIYIDPEVGLDLGIILDPLFVFFALLFLTVFSLGTFIFSSLRRGLILGTLIVSVLFLQVLGLNTLIYTGILILVGILVEAMFWKKN